MSEPKFKPGDRIRLIPGQFEHQRVRTATVLNYHRFRANEIRILKDGQIEPHYWSDVFWELNDTTEGSDKLE